MQNRSAARIRRAAIVTGASSGIGEATARRLAAEGFEVALIARRKERLEALALEIGADGGRAFAIAADLADEGATDRAAREAIECLGHVDVLVNNAGYSPGRSIEHVTRRELQHIFDVNLFSALQLIGAVTPCMRERGGGRIVNIGSIAASIAAPLAIPYAATKIGMEAATDALRLELAPFGIRLSLVIPGFVDTEVFDNAREESRAFREDPTNPYRQTMLDLDELAKKNVRNAISSDDVAKVVLRAATASNPRRRYYTPFTARLQCLMFAILPAALVDTILLRVYGLEKKS